MLFYQSYFPSEHLRPVVARYMVIMDARKHPDWQHMVVMPNGLPGLGFSLGEDFQYHAGGNEKQVIQSSNVIGIHNCQYTARWKQPISFLVVVFKPIGLYHVLNSDMQDLKNTLTNFDLLGLKDSEWICDTLRKLPSPEEKIRFIEAWIDKKIANNNPRPGITDEIAQTIIRQKGHVAIGDLSRQFNINRKYLERHFKLKLGLSPKEFADIIRFNYLNRLLQQKSISWKELAYLGNFHDQSHLIKHFNRITGLTPKAYVQLADQRPEALFIKKHNVYELVMENSPEANNGVDPPLPRRTGPGSREVK